jgi:site-specific DNA recombinase
MTKAAVYLRVSTEEQREKQSIETQRAEVQRYCEQHGVAVFDLYADDGVSGTVPFEERPAGARLLEDARRGRFDTVLIYKLDRLGRDPLVTLLAVEKLKALGVQVKSTTQGFDPDDPVGRLLVTILSGVAGFERETIIQRSIAGTNRLAREGVWLGGIVPYGYRVLGKGKEARLVISEEPIPGLETSEADVIRLIYRLTVEEHRSCVAIANHLEQSGVPPAYTREGRAVLRGKRKEATSGLWRPSRVRNLIVSTTYKGVHQYGKRSKGEREIIEREVPAIVSPEMWARAQEVLRSHLLFSDRNAKRMYLLRGLIKCELCGLTYIGTACSSQKGTKKVYYVCNGRHQARGPYALRGERCPSKMINGDIEEVIWQDIEGFLRDPHEVLRQLSQRLQDQEGQAERLQEELAGLQRAMLGKGTEQERVISLYRRGRIDDAALDQQLDEIQREEKAIKEQIAMLQEQLRGADVAEVRLRSAEDLLRELNQRLDEPLTWELKRQLVEMLVDSVRVATVEQDGKKEAVVTATYRFASTENCTGMGSWRQPG